MTTFNASPENLVHAEMLMSRHLVTLRDDDTMRNAAAVFLDKNISGAPVSDALGRAVGVLTKTDIARYEREHITQVSELDRETAQTTGILERIAQESGMHCEQAEDLVSRWMTPKVFAVDRRATLGDVLRQMSRRKIHRLFVRDTKRDRIVGIITTFDLMRFLARVLLVNGPDSRGRRRSRALPAQ